METPKLKGYEFIKLLGAGKFGEVWKARHLGLNTFRAIKLIPKAKYTPEAVLGLIAEGRIMATLPTHANRISVHELIDGQTNCFLIMDFIDGKSLEELRLQQGKLPWEQATHLMLGVARALRELHEHGVLHRDIKPSNILLDSKRDEAVLVDYGIAVVAKEPMDLAGTPGYMALEIRQGGQSTFKADVYSLAATLFHLVTGDPPWMAKPEESLKKAELSDSLVGIILDGMQTVDRRPDLFEFSRRLRDARWNPLIETFIDQAKPDADVHLDASLEVAIQDEADIFRPLKAIQRPLRIGDLVKLEVSHDMDGYLTVLVINSSGVLDAVFPEKRPENSLPSGRIQRFVFRLEGKAGTEWFVVVWSRSWIEPKSVDWRKRLESALQQRKQAAVLQQGVRDAVLLTHEQRLPYAAKAFAVDHE